MRCRWSRWLLEYPMPTLWVSLLTTLLVIFALVASIHQNQYLVDGHIDQVIAQAIKANTSQTQQATKLFREVDEICRTLALHDSQVHC